MDFEGNESSALVSNPKARIHKSISLDPDLAGVAKQYFGIDLTAIASASDEELAVYADRARAAKELQEVLPILKKHFSQLIEAQTDYEQFLSDVQKDVTSAAKRIDKNILDAWLLGQGYQDHVHLMGQKAHNGRLLQEGEKRSAFNLENLDFNVALQMVARRQQSRMKEINDKIPQAEKRDQMAQQLKEKRQQRKDLLTYGTAGNPQEKSFWDSITDWFSGK